MFKPEPELDLCYCCGAGATLKVYVAPFHMDLCAECEDAVWQFGILVCFEHGPQIPLDVADVAWHKAKPHWKDAWPVKTRRGRRVMVLDYDVSG